MCAYSAKRLRLIAPDCKPIEIRMVEKAKESRDNSNADGKSKQLVQREK